MKEPDTASDAGFEFSDRSPESLELRTPHAPPPKFDRLSQIHRCWLRTRKLCHLLDQTRQAKIFSLSRYAHLLYSIFWLVPIPYLALAGWIVFFSLGIIFEFAPHRKTLVYEAYGNRERSMTLPAWQSLEESLRQRWQTVPGLRRWRQPTAILPPAADLSVTSERLVWFYRTKVVVLAFDAMALAWVATWLGDRHPAWKPAIENGLHALMGGALVLCVLGGLVIVAYFLRIAARSPGALGVLDRHPYAQYLIASQLSLFAGVSIGVDLFRADIEGIAQILNAVGKLGFVAVSIAFLLRNTLPGGERIKKEDGDKFFPLLGFGVLLLAARGMRTDEAIATGLPNWIAAFALTCPMSNLLLGRLFLTWLLRPFHLRQVLSPETAGEIRRVLGFLSATAVLPLGGVAIPWWIYVRHRKWPMWEKCYFKGLIHPESLESRPESVASQHPQRNRHSPQG